VGISLSGLKCANLWSGAVVVFDGLGHAPHLHAPDRFVPVLEALLADVA
jgi:pimeloyl-ACP methyl ester carboxylesterase